MSLGRKSAPSSQALSPRSNIQEAGTQRDSAAISAEASLGVRVPPQATGRGRGDRPSPGADSEVHAPGGLTDARERRTRRVGGGGDRTRCWGKETVLCFDVASRFCCLWIVKSCSGGPPTPAGGCTHTWRSPGCQGPAAQLCSGKIPGWPGRRLPVASSDEIFFLFFLSFFFFSISLKYLQQWGKRRRRNREEGVRGPPRERSKPRTHSPGSSRPKICSPDSRAHRTGNCSNTATPVGWGPCGELCFIRSRPKGGGHWVHSGRAEGAGLPGKAGTKSREKELQRKFHL